MHRRDFLITSGQALGGVALAAAAPSKPRLGLVRSSHKNLARPASPEDPLDYEKVRDMVWKAIEYGAPRAGSLEAKIRRGSWVVVKPNIVFLGSQRSYRSGDVTDFRVTRAIVEYLARRSSAGRITVAEGGSYRSVKDPSDDAAVSQNGVRVDAYSFDWGTEEFPGFGGSLGGMLEEFRKQFPGRRFDYVDLSYDAVRSPSGEFQRIEVPRTARGVGAFGGRSDYFITNTIRNCDFLISAPVMKCHLMCAITNVFKNYVGTAPRQAYAGRRGFSNQHLHDQHSAEDRIDPFIIDLAAFHPPDYCVVDGLRGLQYQEHNINRPDQMVRSNFILAGEDPVAADSLSSHIMGFNYLDMEFLHMAAARDLGVMDPRLMQVNGDDPAEVRRTWIKPRNWYGRGVRTWLVSRDPEAPLNSWKRHTAPGDTFRLADWTGGPVAEGQSFGLAVPVRADGAHKAFLWVGVRGRVVASLNGEKALEEENRTRYRVGQFRQAVQLRSGDNLVVLRLQALTPDPQVSLLFVGPNNDGDTHPGITCRA